MRDLGWFVLSGLVVVFWLSFGPRAVAAELTYGPSSTQERAHRGGMMSVLSSLLQAFSTDPKPDINVTRPQITPSALGIQSLDLMQPGTASARLVRRLTTSQSRLVRCGGSGGQYCLVALRSR